VLTKEQKKICDTAHGDFADLKAVLFNATLKHPSELSHTDTLLDVVAEIFRSQQVTVKRHRLSEYHLAPGVYPDMTEHGWERDDWPRL